MEYRRLGRSGLKVSVLSFGSWVSFDNQMHDDAALECMQAARDAGCNFFDNAEAYAGGESEAIMGRVIRDLGWRRESYVVSSKFYWGINGNLRNKDALRAALRKADFKSTRGAFKFGHNHFPVQNFYLLKAVSGPGGKDPVMEIQQTIFENHKDSYYKDCKMKW